MWENGNARNSVSGLGLVLKVVEVEDRLVQSRVPYIYSREGNAELEYTQLSKDNQDVS